MTHIGEFENSRGLIIPFLNYAAVFNRFLVFLRVTCRDKEGKNTYMIFYVMNSTIYSSISSNNVDLKQHLYQRQVSTPNPCTKSPSSVNLTTPLIERSASPLPHVETNNNRRYSMYTFVNPTHRKYSYWRSFETYSGISTLHQEVRRTGSLYSRRPKRKSKDYMPIGGQKLAFNEKIFNPLVWAEGGLMTISVFVIL